MKFNYGKYIGLPFKDKGRDINGVDCWGLLYLISKEVFGVELPRLDEEYPTSMEANIISGLAETKTVKELFYKIPKGKETIGDAIWIKMLGQPMHVAMVCRRGYMIHILSSRLTSACVRYTLPNWENKIEGFYRNYRIHEIVTSHN